MSAGRIGTGPASANGTAATTQGFRFQTPPFAITPTAGVFFLGVLNGVDFDARMAIYADDGAGLPTGAPLMTGDFVELVDGVGTEQRVPFQAPVALSPSTFYWLFYSSANDARSSNDSVSAARVSTGSFTPARIRALPTALLPGDPWPDGSAFTTTTAGEGAYWLEGTSVVSGETWNTQVRQASLAQENTANTRFTQVRQSVLRSVGGVAVLPVDTTWTQARHAAIRSAIDPADVDSVVTQVRMMVLRSTRVRRDRGPIVSAIPNGWNPDVPEPPELAIPYE